VIPHRFPKRYALLASDPEYNVSRDRIEAIASIILGTVQANHASNSITLKVRSIEDTRLHARLAPATKKQTLLIMHRFPSILSAWIFLVFADPWGGHSTVCRAQVTDEAAAIASFENRIRPLLVERCLECHAEGSEKSGGLALDSLEGMLRGGDSGPAIDLQQPETSLLLRAIGYRDPDLQMPPDSKLSDTHVDALGKWIAAGAGVPESFKLAKPRGAVSSNPVALSVERAREHWAYRPNLRPAIPEVFPLSAGEDPPESPVDAFLLRLQRTMGVAASDRVDLVTWVRRLSIDLHGLNPTYEDLQYWSTVNSASDLPDQMLLRERIVDSMLASPRFGERLARRWMDIVRYAESLTLRGFVLSDAWRYRRYLIEAFDADMPLDQFVSEQIAGDLMPAASVADAQRQWSATTGLVLGDHNYEEQDKLQLEMDIVDEQLDTIGKIFLGQTLGCARCHDHKFDPIPTRDYYAMAGILKSSISVEHENVSKWIRMPLPVDPETERSYAEAMQRKRELEASIGAMRKGLESAATGARIAKHSEFPGIIIDDQQTRRIGDWQASSSVKAYIDDGYLHDKNQERGKKTVTYEPANLPPGNYVVRVAYAHGENRSSKTLIRVSSADGEKELRIDQKQPPADDGLWQTLGTFRFESGGQAYVIVSNEGSDGHVIADAIHFLPEGQALQAFEPRTEEEQQTHALQRADAMRQIERLQQQLKDTNKLLESRPTVQTLKAADTPSDIPIHIRGSVHRLGHVVPRGFLSCINAHDPDLADRATIPPQSNGRLEFARWLIDDANPLPRRVAVNRLWSYLMGSGIVRSLDNFGTTGDPPSDPELLDWLATEFRNSGWSTKRMLRGIAMSAAYQRTAYRPDATRTRDPDNRSFATGMLRRLDAEALRDSILQASGELQLLTRLESTISPEVKEDYRFEHRGGLRAVYQPWFRNALPQLIREFDGANPSYSIAQRDRSTVATQALKLMNSPWIAARGQAATERLMHASPQTARGPGRQEDSIRMVFRNTLGRDPDPAELAWADEMLREGNLASLAQHLFASIDFRYAP
jgi:hypothetical protein